MRSVSLSDSTYDQARAVAESTGRTLEAFVEEAVLRFTEEETPLRLSPEQMAQVEQGLAEIRAGKGLTLEQVAEEIERKKAEWLEANHA